MIAEPTKRLRAAERQAQQLARQIAELRGQRACRYCGTLVTGRADKRFCGAPCRARFAEARKHAI